MTATANARSTIPAVEASVGDRITRRQLSVVSRSGPSQRPSPPVHLTPRQLEVLALLCEGLPNKLICRRLNISAGTVKAHISSILRELGVASRLQAVVWARHRRILTDLGIPGQEEDADADTPDNSCESREAATSIAFPRRRALN